MGISKISIDDDYCVLDNILAIHLPAGGYLAENGEVYSPDDVVKAEEEVETDEERKEAMQSLFSAYLHITGIDSMISAMKRERKGAEEDFRKAPLRLSKRS